LLGAVGLLALVGVRYPLQMLPLMIFELTWKTIWLIAMALPLVMAHRVTPELRESITACGMGVILLTM
jgi:hypothetical protein